MVNHRIKDHAKNYRLRRCQAWNAVMKLMWKRWSNRSIQWRSLSGVYYATRNFGKELEDHRLCIARCNRISFADFTFNFNRFSNLECVSNFRFRKDDIPRISHAIDWPTTLTHTKRNGFGVTPILAACILLRRFASPCRWSDVEEFFGKHASHLSEIFWETLEQFLDKRLHLLMGPIGKQFVARKAPVYSAAVEKKSLVTSNCIGFIDGTVIGIARPKGNMMQQVVYNGHKRKHALKYQAVTTPDGLILHAYGPMEGRRHDWTMYVKSDLDSQLADCLNTNGRQFCLYGDSGYNRRIYLDVPFQGSNLIASQTVANVNMSKSRVTVEWIFKEIKLYWTAVDFKRKLRVEQLPAGTLYTGAMLLTNIRNCCYPNSVSQYFDCQPPTLDEYLSHKDSDN